MFFKMCEEVVFSSADQYAYFSCMYACFFWFKMGCEGDKMENEYI